MAAPLADRTAIITGAATGLGRAFCVALLEKGAKVCVTDIDKNGGKNTVKEFRCKYGRDKAIFAKCDVRKAKELEAAFEKAKKVFGGINIVVNNAGITGECEDSWHRTVDVNLNGVIRGTLLGIEHLRKDLGGPGGVIINTGSALGFGAVPFGPVYTATKQGVVALTRNWAENSFGTQFGIRFCAICPSLVRNNALGSSGPVESRNAGVHRERTELLVPDYVAEGFMKLVEDNRKHGSVLKITKAGGFEYVFD